MNNRGSSQIILKPGQSFASTVGKVKADEDGTAEKAITLKNGEKAEFYKIPYGTEHQIKEEKNEYEPSYRIDAATVVKAANKAPANTDLSTETEIIDMGEDNTVTFTNILSSFHSRMPERTIKSNVCLKFLVQNFAKSVQIPYHICKKTKLVLTNGKEGRFMLSQLPRPMADTIEVGACKSSS